MFDSDKKFSKSFRNTENKKSVNFLPVSHIHFLGVRQGKNSDCSPLYCTHDCILSYILYTTVNIFPFIPLFVSDLRQVGRFHWVLRIPPLIKLTANIYTCIYITDILRKGVLKGNFAIFYMLAKYVPDDIKYIFTKFYRHISTNNEANRKFVILISNFFMGCDVLAR